MVKSFSDQILVEHGHKLPKKPDGLRTLKAASPARIMLKAGMFWQVYMKEAPFKYDVKYKLPGKYEELYQYDAIIVANQAVAKNIQFAGRGDSIISVLDRKTDDLRFRSDCRIDFDHCFPTAVDDRLVNVGSVTGCVEQRGKRDCLVR